MEQQKSIRVAQIMGKFEAGGVEMVVFNYYRAIDKAKVQFDFYYDADSTVEPPQELFEMGARFIKIPPYQRLPIYLKTLRKHFKENKYMIVHSHINTLSIFPLFVAWTCHIPVRIAHNHSVPGGNEFKRNMLKNFLKLFAKLFPTDFFACSEKAGRWMFGDRTYNSGRVFIMKNAIDFNRFKLDENDVAQKKKEFNLNNKLVVGHIGRFTYAKNHKFLIDTFENICKIRQDAVLLLVGDGELSNEIHKIVSEKRLDDKVIFVGQVSNPENYYHLIDVIVIPSFFEGLSLTTIESQIAGIPVVVSEAIPEETIISDGVRKLSLKDNDWASKVVEMCSSKVTLNERSLEYDIHLAVNKLENRYTEAII